LRCAGAHERKPFEISSAGDERFLDVGDAVNIAEVARRVASYVERLAFPMPLDERVERNGCE
jgi:hypothetical protein